MIELILGFGMPVPGEIDTYRDACGAVEIEWTAPDDWPFSVAPDAFSPAMATVDSAGRRIVFVNVDHDPDFVEGFIGHEKAHLETRCLHGDEKFSSHGEEFQRACRRHVKKGQFFFCKGYF